MNNIKIWKFFVPYYGMIYLIKCGKTFGFRTELPISNFQGISIAVFQGLCYGLPLLILGIILLK